MDGLDIQVTSSTVNSYMMEPLHSQPHPSQMQQHHMSSLPNMPMNPHHHTHHQHPPPSYTHHYTQQQQQQQQEYLPPSPAVMDTSRGGHRQWFDTDL